MTTATIEQEKAAVNELLTQVDENCIRLHLPILSVVMLTDDGFPSIVGIQSIGRYRLRKWGESVEQAVQRLQTEAYDALEEGLYPESIGLNS